jgi:hypothetical protein
MLVETSYPARVGEEIGFEIPLDGNTFTGRGRFASVTALQAADDARRYETGVGFIGLSPSGREMLRHYMAQRGSGQAG